MFKIPAGITSSVKTGNKKFILQTEFISTTCKKSDSEQLSEAHGKIITTVAIEGQVVHKVDKVYSTPLETEEDFLQAENAVKNQHLSVARKVASKPKEFLNLITQIDITAEDKLRLISGVADVIKIDFSGSNEETDLPFTQSPLLKNIHLLRDLVISISQNTRVKKLKKVVGAIGNEKFMLTGFGGSTYYLNLKSDADVAGVIKELENIRTR